MGSIHQRMERDLATAQRAALRQRLVVVPPSGHALRAGLNRPARYCANCAGSLEFGAVLSGNRAYCSVECSIESRPA